MNESIFDAVKKRMEEHDIRITLRYGGEPLMTDEERNAVATEVMDVLDAALLPRPGHTCGSGTVAFRGERRPYVWYTGKGAPIVYHSEYVVERYPTFTLRELEDLKANLTEFFGILDAVEETDEGRLFHPTSFSSCRVLAAKRGNEILQRLKELCQLQPEADKSSTQGTNPEPK